MESQSSDDHDFLNADIMTNGINKITFLIRAIELCKKGPELFY